MTNRHSRRAAKKTKTAVPTNENAIIFNRAPEEMFRIAPDRKGLMVDWAALRATAEKLQAMPPEMPVAQPDIIALAVYLAYQAGQKAK